MSALVQRLAPWLVGAAACLLYLVTLSNHATGDSIEFALAIERATPAVLLDPYHPLLHPAGLLFYRLWQLVGWTGRALVPLQVLNALAGGVCAGLLTAIASVLTRSRGLAALIGAGFAISGAQWLLSVEAEFVTVPLALALVVLWLLLAASPALLTRTRTPVLLGLTTVAAAAAYVSNALLVAVVLVGLRADGRLQPGLRRRHGRIYLAVVLMLFAPAYLAFLAAWSRGNWRAVPAYFLGRGTYGHWAPFNIPHGVYAFLRSLALYPNLSLGGTTRQFLAQASLTGRLLFAGYYGLILVAVLAPFWLGWRRWSELWPARHRALLVLGTWLVLFSAFGFYWVPGDLSFWLPSLAVWWLIASLVLGVAEVRWRRLATVAAAVVILGLGNALFEVLPRHDLQRNLAHQVARQVIANTAQEEILLVRGDDIAGLYLQYWGDRRVVYVSGGAKSLAEALSWVEGVQPGSRLLVVDSDEGRARWWYSLFASSEGEGSGVWLPSIPRWRSGGGLVLELTAAGAHR